MVVVIGDSHVERWRDLAARGAPRWRILNRGISGQTTSQIRRRFADDVLALRPAAVIIFAGSNDIRRIVGDPARVPRRAGAQALNNILAMGDAARAAGLAVAIAAVPPVVAPLLSRRGARRDPAVIVDFNTSLAAAAHAHGWVFLDFHTVLTNGEALLAPAFTNDGLHPNAAGYAAMEPVLLAALDHLADH